MSRMFICPLCGDESVAFSGVAAFLLVRKTCEKVALLTCNNSHVFSILMADVSAALGLRDVHVAKFGDITKNINRLKRNLAKLPGMNPDQKFAPPLDGKSWEKTNSDMSSARPSQADTLYPASADARALKSPAQNSPTKKNARPVPTSDTTRSAAPRSRFRPTPS